MRDIFNGYRRDLPHLQRENATIFVTFSTQKRLIILPPAARDIVLEHLLFEHDFKHHVHVAVVMPEHVHMITTPLSGPDGPYLLSEIMKPIKGVSSRRINKLMKRSGTLWHDESFDHVLRNDEKLQEKADYVMMNPVRRGLASTPDEYAWLWRDWVEGLQQSRR
ncbi:MAG: transposase [Thermoanaerobaculia bacterium]